MHCAVDHRQACPAHGGIDQRDVRKLGGAAETRSRLRKTAWACEVDLGHGSPCRSPLPQSPVAPLISFDTLVGAFMGGSLEWQDAGSSAMPQSLLLSQGDRTPRLSRQTGPRLCSAPTTETKTREENHEKIASLTVVATPFWGRRRAVRHGAGPPTSRVLGNGPACGSSMPSWWPNSRRKTGPTRFSDGPGAGNGRTSPSGSPAARTVDPRHHGGANSLEGADPAGQGSCRAAAVDVARSGIGRRGCGGGRPPSRTISSGGGRQADAAGRESRSAYSFRPRAASIWPA